VNSRDDDLFVRPGRISDKGRGATKPNSFVDQVICAAKRASYTGTGFGRQRIGTGSRFGRGRSAALALSPRSPSRRAVMKGARCEAIRCRFRSAPLSRHMAYLNRDGVTRNGSDARMFDASSEVADERAFTERCKSMAGRAIFSSRTFEPAGDAAPEAIVEVRAYEDAQGLKRLLLATR